jgi:hypothetical protein
LIDLVDQTRKPPPADQCRFRSVRELSARIECRHRVAVPGIRRVLRARELRYPFACLSDLDKAWL